MSLFNNGVSLTFCRTIFKVMGKTRVLGRERLPDTHDGLLLACVHLSHYDPFAISVLHTNDKVSWMARIESFQTPLSSWLTRNCGAFRIDRFGFALPGIREGLARLDEGEVVGIYPEGEVLKGANSVLNGASMKRGVGLLARRSGVPVVPCIVLNSQHFSNPVSWMPFRTGRLWLGYGEPLFADQNLPHGRASRIDLTERLEQAFRQLHAEMIDQFEIPVACCPVRTFQQDADGPVEIPASATS